MTLRRREEALGKRILLSPSAIQNKCSRVFELHGGEWAAALFLRGVGDSFPDSAHDLEMAGQSFGLGVPTEKQVQADIVAARRWVQEWHEFPHHQLVVWVEMNWSCVGTQRVPSKLRCESWIDVMRVADQMTKAACLEDRMGRLVQCWVGGWQAAPQSDCMALAAVVRNRIEALLSLSDEDWVRLIGVVDWIAAGNELTPYVRQLPVRGIDTKWLARHLKLVEEIARAVRGPQFSFPLPPPSARIRILDSSLYVSGLSDLKLPLDQMARLPIAPETVIVCENLVSLLTLPSLPSTVGVFGSGYAVSGLSSLPWFADASVLYWGDLDTHGFAILHGFRRAVPHVRSVMMDEETLERHLDLAVEEPAPLLRSLDMLTEEEQKALARLRRGDPERGICSLRLEQERVEWVWACERLRTLTSSCCFDGR